MGLRTALLFDYSIVAVIVIKCLLRVAVAALLNSWTRWARPAGLELRLVDLKTQEPDTASHFRSGSSSACACSCKVMYYDRDLYATMHCSVPKAPGGPRMH